MDDKENMHESSTEEASDAMVSYIPLSKKWFKVKADEISKDEVYSEQHADSCYSEFRNKYAPEVLLSLSDDDLLARMFPGESVVVKRFCNALSEKS